MPTPINDVSLCLKPATEKALKQVRLKKLFITTVVYCTWYISPQTARTVSEARFPLGDFFRANKQKANVIGC